MSIIFKGDVNSVDVVLVCRVVQHILLGILFFFDASEESAPWNITVGAIGVRGIVNAIQKMKPGSVWEVFIPSALGFGIQGDPSGVVGPNQVLIYELELLDVNKK